MKDLLDGLFSGQVLDAPQALALMDGIIESRYPPEQVAALLAVYRMRLPTGGELSGFRESLLRRATALDLDADDAIDLVGTGGDRKDTFNVTTLSALVVAAAGHRVVKHGNGSSSSKHGSSDTLRAAGLGFRQNERDLRRQLDAANIAFVHAPLFHPALAPVASVRRALGVSTIFNLLGPLVNPARPGYHFIGVADARMQGAFAESFATHATGYNVVHAMDDYDEATLTGPVRCFTHHGRYTIQPRDVNLPPTRPADIAAAPNATAQFLRILRGEGTRAETDTVALNAGLAIEVKTGDRLKACISVARETLRSGAAFVNFEKLLAA